MPSNSAIRLMFSCKLLYLLGLEPFQRDLERTEVEKHESDTTQNCQNMAMKTMVADEDVPNNLSDASDKRYLGKSSRTKPADYSDEVWRFVSSFLDRIFLLMHVLIALVLIFHFF